MRMPIGILSLAVVLSACGEDIKPRSNVKGTATLNFDGCPYTGAAIYDGELRPTLNDYGAPVSNGDGFKVSCSLGSQGTSLQAHIESGSMSLDVNSSDGSNARMIFFVDGPGGTPQTIMSVDANNNLAPTCTLTTSRSGTLLTAGNGTIFAEYSCAKVLAPANVGAICRTQGLFYFSGCGG